MLLHPLQQHTWKYTPIEGQFGRIWCSNVSSMIKNKFRWQQCIDHPPMILNISGEAMSGLVSCRETEVCWCSLKLQIQHKKNAKMVKWIKQVEEKRPQDRYCQVRAKPLSQDFRQLLGQLSSQSQHCHCFLHWELSWHCQQCHQQDWIPCFLH